MRATYSLVKRRRKGRTVYYIRTAWSESLGRYTRTIATDKTTKAEARMEAERKLQDGIVPSDRDPFLFDYLVAFWHNDSQYAKSRATRGKALSRRYLELNAWAIGKLMSNYRPFGKLQLSKLTPAAVEAWVQHWLDTGASARTVNVGLQSIKVAVSWWAKQNRVVNPLGSFEKLKEPDNPRGALTLGELSALIQLEDSPLRGRVAVLLAALAGLRISEVRGLQWEDVDVQSGVLNIRNAVISNSNEHAEPKFGSVGQIPAPRLLIDEMMSLGDKSPFGRRGFILYSLRSEEPYGYAAIVRRYNSMLRAIGIDAEEQKTRRLSFHSLRHTFVSLARLSGIPDFVVQGMARHKSLGMTERYSHSSVIDFREYREKIDGTLQTASSEVK